MPRVRTAALVVLATACESTPERASTAGPDTLNGRLAPGVNLCEYEDVAPEFPPPDDSGDWLESGQLTPYLECSDGGVWADVHVLHSQTGREVGVSIDVQLFDVVGASGGDWVRGQVLDPLEGLDDCGLIELEATGTIAIPNPTVTFLESPLAEVHADRWARTLVDYNPTSSSPTYSAWLTGEAELPPERADLSLEVASGGTAPELSLIDLVTLPSRLEVTEPDLSWESVIPRADTTFRWTGVPGDEPVRIWLFVRSEFNGQAYPMYEVECEVVDDGEFVVPGEILATFPEGWSALVDVGRYRVAWMGTIEGRSFRTGASARHFAHSVLLGP